MGRTNGGTALLELQSHSQLPPVPRRPRLAPVRTRGRKLQRHDAALGHWLVGSHSARQACSPFRSSPSNRAGVGTPRRLTGPRSPVAKTTRGGRSRRLGIEGTWLHGSSLPPRASPIFSPVWLSPRQIRSGSHRRRQYPVRCGYSRPTVRSTAAYREGSTMSMQSPAAPPRPRRSGPLLTRQPASLLPVWT